MMVGSSLSAIPVYWLTCCCAVSLERVSSKETSYIQVVRYVPLEAVDNRGGIVEERANIRRGNVRACTGKVDAIPPNELVFAAMVVVVLR